MLLLAGACKKDTDPQPDKQPSGARSAEVNVAATYYDATPARGMNYLAFSPTAKLSSDRVELEFKDAYSRERLRFVIPKSRQKAGWVGTYTLATQPDPGQGEAQFEYYRFFNETTNNTLSSNSHRLPGGTLVITAYDASRQLLSGTFSLTVIKAKDPFLFTPVPAGSPNDPRADADVKIYGSFLEIPLL